MEKRKSIQNIIREIYQRYPEEVVEEVLAQGFSPANVSTKHMFRQFEPFLEGGNLMRRTKTALAILAFANGLDKEEAITRG